jgi:hypothetical protein
MYKKRSGLRLASNIEGLLTLEIIIFTGAE